MNYYVKTKFRNLSNRFRLLNRLYKFLNRRRVVKNAKLSDESFAAKKYKENTGRTLNLKNPTTFNEKLWWLKLNNRDPLLTICSDKIEVRKYVKEKGLEHILNPIIAIYEKPEDIDFNILPEKAFIKVNNSSGYNYLWNGDYKKLNRRKFNQFFNRALKNNYYLQSREYNYKNIKPKIVVEHYIKDNSELGLVDYKFLCIDGKVELLLVDIDVANNDGSHNPEAKRNIYDKDFNLQHNIKIKREHFDEKLIKKPKNFDLMVKYAEILSEPFPTCRVDLYNINGKIIFGEITFYTGGGTQIIDPYELEVRLGKMIDLNSPKIIYKG